MSDFSRFYALFDFQFMVNDWQRDRSGNFTLQPIGTTTFVLVLKIGTQYEMINYYDNTPFFFFNYSWMCDESWEYDMTYIWFFARNVYLKNKSINSLLPRQIGRRKMPLPVRFIDIYLKGQCHAIWVEFH